MSRVYLRLPLLALLTLISVCLGLAGTLRGVESSVQDMAFAARQHDASGQLHIVEMDAASVAEIARWPWARSQYARLIDRLNSAGVRSITFDVDFSSASEPSEDADLARALASSKASVILPTFAQQATADSKRQLDALPIPALRQHVMLGSVAVLPDRDGLVRNMPLGTMTAGVPRPSLSAQIAKRSGQMGAYFPIDFSIDPSTIPRHSFHAVENGRFDPGAVRGKDILIGATAIEMGDRYATPRYGVLPGVVVQALAGETLYDGVPEFGGWVPAMLLAVLIAFVVLRLGTNVSVGATLAIGWVFLFAFKYLAYDIWLISFEIVPAMGLILLAAAAQVILMFRAAMKAKRLVDSETGLPNLRAMEGQASSTDCFVVAAMIDEFDTIRSVIEAANVGTLIDRIAERLRASGQEGRIYRIDDRVLAWETEMDHQTLQEQIASIRQALRKPVEIGGRRIDISMRFGVAEAGGIAHASHAASIALREDLPWHLHKSAEREAMRQQISLMGELDDAIGKGELEVLYQPKLDLASDTITSVEALIRWHHPDRGYLRPDSFIPLAEQADRIADLTLFVLERTMADLAHWCASGVVLKAAVNISARLIVSPDFIASAEHMIEQSRIPRDRLIFEITESATLTDPEAATAALHRFSEMGVEISMDDYGTGQATLTYLRNLPLSELKIDRSFVQHAHVDKNDALLVRSTVELAHSFGLRVVAEGVEDAECLAFLRSVNCDLAQGYFIGKPMPAEQLSDLPFGQLPRAA